MRQSTPIEAAPSEPRADAVEPGIRHDRRRATAAAVVAADGARVREALEGVSWERHGPLRRLRKTQPAPVAA